MPTKAKVKTTSSKKTQAKKKAKSSKTATKKVAKKEVVKEEVVKEEVVEEPAKKKSRVVNRDSVLELFDTLVGNVEEEIERLRSAEKRCKGVKYLRTVNKKVKELRSKAARVMKKRRVSEKKNTNSGFLKPVKISKEMAQFTGWNQKDLKSRVDVTKYICNYIKDNDLQNPSDRRQILADSKLSKLLKYDSKTSDPLTYYKIQTYMKPHFLPSA